MIKWLKGLLKKEPKPKIVSDLKGLEESLKAGYPNQVNQEDVLKIEPIDISDLEHVFFNVKDLKLWKDSQEDK